MAVYKFIDYNIHEENIDMDAKQREEIQEEIAGGNYIYLYLSFVPHFIIYVYLSDLS